VDKRKTPAEPPEQASEPQRDRKADEGSNPEAGRRAGDHRPKDERSGGRSVRPPWGTIGHLGLKHRDGTSDLTPKEQIAAQARRMPELGGAAEYIRTGAPSAAK
jgi:hypothetical protein